jgi:phage replication-related protein YjqB (UPF0714/DUF867 family)
MTVNHTDRYASYAELARAERHGEDYGIVAIPRASSSVLIIAPHGGRIEHGTSELARCIAGEEYGFYAFEGYKPRGQNRALHVTSHRFDEPRGLALVQRAEVVVAIHGCIGSRQICIGGLDVALAATLAETLTAAALPVLAHGHRYPARHPLNICNRSRRRCGAQLEFTADLRELIHRASIACAVRDAISRHLVALSRAAQAVDPASLSPDVGMPRLRTSSSD